MVATTRGGRGAEAVALVARSAETSASAARLGTRMGLLAVEQPQDALRPGDRRTRALEPVEQRQVGKEVHITVDRALDLLELRELFACEPLALGHLLPEGAQVGMTSEEELEQQAVAGDARDGLGGVEPRAQGAFAGRHDRVELFVRALLLRDRSRPRQATLDEARQDRVDLALRRAPEVADAAASELVELVARSFAQGQQAENRVFGVREAGRH